MPGHYCWQKMAWRSGFYNIWGWSRYSRRSLRYPRWRQYAVNFRAGALSGVLYIWLPFMILPVQAALERLPPSLLQASADLGARPRQTFRYVVLPLAIPGIAAGSIFTFSLTLGDFIVPQLVGPPGYFIGNMVYSQQGRLAICRWRRHSPGADCSHRTVLGVRETSGSVRCTLNAHRFSLNWQPGAAWFSYISHPDYRRLCV